MADIQVENITKIYSTGTKALDDISLNIEKGEFYGLIGVNGAGKTTLINALTGQIKPDSGTIDVLGLDSSKNGEKVRAKVGILPEKESPILSMTPEEYFNFIGDVRGINSKKLTENINMWVDKLEISEEMNILNKNLSRGQQQKILFAATFLHEPDIVFIDEPLANLDPLIQERLKNYLVEYNKNENKTIILSTHYLDVATELCGTLGIMKNGKMIGEYNVDDINTNNIKNLLIDGDSYD